jgi:N-acetylglutamate synthase-like GNAT family acetyltransferase
MTNIRKATLDDRPPLIELMRRASLVWEDTRAQLLAQPELIDVPAQQIEAGQVLVATAADDATLLGFAAHLPRDDGDLELDGLFTEPARFREGIGTALVRAVERAAVALGAQHLHVLANCNVLAFYEAVGFVSVGEVETPLGPVASRMQKPVSPASSGSG